MVKLTSAPGRSFSRQLRGNSSLGLLAAYLGLVVVFALVSPAFLSPPNLVNIAQTLAIIAIVAAGQTLVVISGGVDLSVGATAALSGVVIGLLYNNAGLPIWPATTLGLLSGVLVGLLNGLVVTRLRINAVIATLGSLSIVRGAAFVFTGAETARLEVESFKFIGRGAIAGIPVPLLIMVVVFAALFVFLNHTDAGRRIYAVGGNADAARLAGVDVDRTRLLVYVLCGLLSALGGVLLAAQLAASFPKAANGLELTVIAAVILGGCSLSGGKGGVLGALLGVLVLRTLDNGLVLANVSSYYQEVARGAVLLLAVGFDQLRTRRRRKGGAR